MNEWQSNLYNDLVSLCSSEDSPFYFVDQSLDGDENINVYRIFNYRLASYTDFLQPNALNCRGATFQIDENDNALALSSLPFPKFFNLNENPFTENLDMTQIKVIQDKMDGSLISTYLYDDTLLLKTKGSLNSFQANDSYKWLIDNPKNEHLYNFLVFMAQNHNTVCLEWTSPNNRIVLPYSKSSLTVLSARNELNGEEIPYSHLKEIMCEWECNEFLDKDISSTQEENIKLVEAIPSMTKIEGFVFTMVDGMKWKLKTSEYNTLHRAKDAITHPRPLFECVVNEAHDDLRGMFHDDPVAISRINAMEAIVKDLYKKLDNIPLKFYNEHRTLDRKNYAILGQKELEPLYFHIAMSLYIGKEIDYKEWLIKHFKDFDIELPDITIEDDEE